MLKSDVKLQLTNFMPANDVCA